MSNIKFGTDGWRAIIDKDFIPSNIAKVIQAFCDLNQASSNKVIYIGFDRRRNSKESANLVAEILAANGFKVHLSDDFCPTPCISWLVKTNKALAGIIITASHNPPQWNGIKFKESYGGAASPNYTSRIEHQIEHNDIKMRLPERTDLSQQIKSGRIELFSPDDSYAKHLKSFINIDLINKQNYKIAVDPLFGAGTNFIKKILNSNSVIQIHDAADTNFGGLNPEPIDKNLQALKKTVLENRCDIGLATDGDADRIGAYDEFGNFISSHQIFSLLLRHNITVRKLSGPIVKSVSTTILIDRICSKYNLPLITTPIGFKHISQELVAHNALMGGEESGGISLREHVHERDGVLNGLLLLEIMATHQKPISQIIKEMDQEFGKLYFARHDYRLTDDHVTAIQEKTKIRDVTTVSGVTLAHYDDTDGMRYVFEDESWLLVRTSGTEPLLRVYAEGPSQQRVEDLHAMSKDRFSLK